MAGPGSRLEKAGTIFSRVRGLLRSGALKDSEKPLWYDVYAAFPPRIQPEYERAEPSVTVQKILYKEDLVRAKFYKTYGNPDVVDMKDHDTPTISQRFADKYFEIREQGQTESTSIFEATTEALKSDGFKLKSLEEILEEKRAAVAKRIEESQLRSAEMPDIEGASRSAGTESSEAEDTLDEDIAHPNYDEILNKSQPK